MGIQIKLRWYQDEAVESVYQYYKSGKTGNPVIALPTGTGKSHVISSIQKRAMQTWPNQRFLNLTHIKELVWQNYKKMLEDWPTAPVGINSAGLGYRDVNQSIIFAGIASIVKNPQVLGHRDLIIIDECHLVSPKAKTMYNTVVSNLKKINPRLKVIGLTATPYRLGQGKIIEEGIFTDIIYDLTNFHGFNRLLAENFLVPLIPRKTNAELDISGVGISNGDYKIKALQNAVDKKDVTHRALMELCKVGFDRKNWLIFASGVEHAEHIADMLQSFGVSSVAVHSKIKADVRDERISGFKKGKYRCIVNNNILTTGFDHPPIDLIGMFRPTTSPGLWVQMLGRGTRPSNGKTDCLVLDFAGNTKRLGPINNPSIPQKKNAGGGDLPVKICQECSVYNHISAKLCIYCQAEFPVQEKLKPKSSTLELLHGDQPIIKTYKIYKILYFKHVKLATGSISMRCDYYTIELERFSEWIHFGRTGFPGYKARQWWKQRHDSPLPRTVKDALTFTSEFREPQKIKAWVNKKYPEILAYEF